MKCRWFRGRHGDRVCGHVSLFVLERVNVWRHLGFQDAGRALFVHTSVDGIFSASNSLVGGIVILDECESYLEARLCMHTKTTLRGCMGLASWKQVPVDIRCLFIGDSLSLGGNPLDILERVRERQRHVCGGLSGQTLD